MAEAIMNRRGAPHFKASSAGSQPAGTVRPEALQQLESAGISTTGLRSKSWDDFTQPGSPHFNFIFTVCDNAAREACPLWPGQPGQPILTAHWGIPDPAAVQGTPEQIQRAYQKAFAMLSTRIGLFLALPLATMDAFAIKKEIDCIGSQKATVTDSMDLS